MPYAERVSADQTIWTIVVAAGSGTRFGGLKQLSPLAGSTVLGHAVATAAAASDGVIVVAPADRRDDIAESLGEHAEQVVAGGATRSESVRAGLAAVPDSASIVLVHDGARPLATAGIFERVIESVAAGADAAVPVVALADTIRDLDRGTVDRSRLVAVQTPQGFRAELLRSLHAHQPDATDDAGLVEAAGGTVTLVEGDERNRKITQPVDLVIAAALLAHAEANDPTRSTNPGGAPVGRAGKKEQHMDVRIGNGFDIHRFDTELSRPLVLGGVTIPGTPGLVGHSDGDAIAHACADAMLGAAGLGDIGTHFPDTDEAWAGADSIELLRATATKVRDEGWSLANIDCSVVCEQPKLAPHRVQMQALLSDAAGGPVSVKGRRAEQLGPIGEGLGIVCFASALLVKS